MKHSSFLKDAEPLQCYSKSRKSEAIAMSRVFFLIFNLSARNTRRTVSSRCAGEAEGGLSVR